MEAVTLTSTESSYKLWVIDENGVANRTLVSNLKWYFATTQWTFTSRAQKYYTLRSYFEIYLKHYAKCYKWVVVYQLSKYI